MDSASPAGPAQTKRLAPWLPIPSRAISVVEHPCIVKNVDKGIASLGGPVKLSKGLRSRIETTTNADGDEELKKLISVSLRPDDPFAKRLLSTPVRTNNLLLKVTVPKRTGRKRKRGSTGPFLSESELGPDSQACTTNATAAKQNDYVDASTVFRTLKDNASNYQVSVAGILDETHRFRGMPDLQYAASRNDAMVGLRDHILPQRYSGVKTYKFNTAAGRDLTKSVGPSAEFIQMPVSYNYRFQQSTFVKYTEQGPINFQSRIPHDAFTIVKPTIDSVPTEPKSKLPEEVTLTPYLQVLIHQIRAELAIRPIITRHLLYNKLGWDRRTNIRKAAAYCGYFFETGPWREALIRWGLDPRQIPEYRKYQTIAFLSYDKTVHTKRETVLSRMALEDLENEHTFDGVTLSKTGNLYQFCDITDPLIAKILSTEDIRTTCAPTFQGWYHVGTWAKATVILKDKMNIILAGSTPDDSLYQRVLEWPERWDDKDMAAKYKAEWSDREIHAEKKKEHALMYSIRIAARNPRYAFEKLNAAEQGEEQIEGADGKEDTDEVGTEVDANNIGIPEDLTEDPVTAETMLDEDGVDINDDNGKDVVIDDADDGDSSEDGEQRIPNTDDEDDDNDDDDDEDEDEDDDNGPGMYTRTRPEGPAPFGGYYKV